ncbi:MAG: hypothetical protein K9W43_14255 [Candidatus Thorarchaeota archaeon]|nr:hypothetical protein [Candidatus Thorarchaeota archaeon]
MQEFTNSFSIVLAGIILSWFVSFIISYTAAAITKLKLEKKDITKQRLSAAIDMAGYGCCLGPVVLLGSLSILLTVDQIIANLNLLLILIWLLGLLIASYMATTLVKKTYIEVKLKWGQKSCL